MQFKINLYLLRSMGAVKGQNLTIAINNWLIQLFELPDKATNLNNQYARLPVVVETQAHSIVNSVITDIVIMMSRDNILRHDYVI